MPTARSGPAVACEGNCIVDYSVVDLGFGVPDRDVEAAAKACRAAHEGDARCDTETWQAGQDMATCQVCKKGVDVEKDSYVITLEYKEKFGQVFWVFRSPSRAGNQVIHWVSATDGVYKGPWTLPEGQDP